MPTPGDAGWSPAAGEILTVSELMGRVRGALEEQFSWVWIEGELSNLRIPASGHAYFTLLDRGAQLRAVCFRSTLRLLAVRPADGMRVLARGRVTVYETRGDVQLVVEDLEAEGEGLLRLELEARKRQLAAEGLFDAGRKRALPELPRGIGVVTSATGAAFQDILQVLGRRAPGVDVFLAPARVQGEGAAEELRAALELVASHPAVEVVILGRGGGAAEDLGAFDNEALVRAVVACGVPVVSAVGHEIDLSLCDLAADLRAPTPSAAAELAVREWGAWAERRERVTRSLESAYRTRLERLQGRVQRLDPRVYSPRLRLQRLAVAVDRGEDALVAATRERLHGFQGSLSGLETRLARCAPERRLRERSSHLEHLWSRLQTGARRVLVRRREQLDRWHGELGALSPLAVLDRGYAVVQDASGTVLREAASCVPGAVVDVRLARGELGCVVQSVQGPAKTGEEGR